MSWRKQRPKVEQRLRAVLWAQEHGPSQAARRFGCSRTTVYALLGRYERAGLQGLLMSRPRGPRLALAPAVVEAVELKTSRMHRSTARSGGCWRSAMAGR